MSNILQVIVILIGALISIIALITYLQNPRKGVNISFALFSFLMASWLVFNYQSTSLIGDSINTKLYIELVLVVTALMGHYLLRFSYQFPNKTLANYSFGANLLILLHLSLSVTFSFLAILGQIVLKVEFEGTNIYPTFSTFYFLYLIILFSSLLVTTVNLVGVYRRGDLRIRKQTRQLFYGLGLTIAAALVTNLFFVILLNDSSAVAIGPIFTIFFVVFTARAVFETQLLGVRVLVGKLLYYFILGLLPYAVFFILGSLFIKLFGSLLHPIALSTGVLAAIAFIYLYNSFDTFLKREVTTRLINPGYDPFEVVDSLGKQLAVTLDINEVASSINSILARTIRAQSEGIVVISNALNTNADTEGNNVQTSKEISQYVNPRTMNFLIFGDKSIQSINAQKYQDLLFVWEKASRAPVIVDELDLVENSVFKDLVNWMKPVVSQMKEDKLKVIVPIGTKDRVLGMLFLGQKEADAPYTRQDIDLLTSVASTAGLAVARSLFYQEVKDFNQSLQRRIEVATDDLRKQNESLEIAMNRLERLRQQEQDMLDVLGHELRTPITIVRNALAVLQMDYAPDKQIDPTKLESYISKALESTKREMVLIETLLAATKIDANRVQINLDKVDIIDVINDSIEAQEIVAKDRNIEITFHKPEETAQWLVYADRTRIQEVQDNFLSNAVKYTIKGKVEIFVSRESGAEQEFIKVSIKDTGIGIPPEDIPKLGRKFFRARQYIKDSDIGAVVRPGGTGLGLYVSFELVKIMGGQVKVESVVGEGSTFSFTMPVYTNQEPKHIDQTFDSDQDLEQQLLDKRERDRKKLEQQANEDKQIEQSHLSIPNPDANEQYKKLSTANDIISQINSTRKLMENPHQNEESNSSQQEKNA